MVPTRITSAMRLPDLAANATHGASALTDSILPAQASVQELAELPEADLQDRLSRLPWPDRRRTVRLVDKLGNTAGQPK
jgi:hypothetical protein